MFEQSTSQRLRVCGAILRGETILMVQHSHDGRTYWTLPGGGVEAGETATQAVIREVLEETGLTARVDRFLFAEPYTHGMCECYLLIVDETAEPALGFDPEESDLSAADRMLKHVAWKSLTEMHADLQVSQVLVALNTT